MICFGFLPGIALATPKKMKYYVLDAEK